jgi:hypothetical protein
MMYRQFAAFQYDCPPDPSTFLLANYTRLAEMAWVYDDLFQRNHLPLNYTANCVYNDTSYSVIKKYDFTDNGALWTGIAMAAWVYHYVAAVRENNNTDRDYALSVVQRMIHGMSMMMIVPNGGLGPEYGGILARGWAGPEHRDICPYIFDEGIRYFNGSGNYKDYRWRGYTSNDEYGGYYMGLALALKFIPDPYVQTTVKLIIEQLTNYMLLTNFLGISGPGGPSGVNQKAKFMGGAFWVATLLKMASIVNPEKYEEKYYHWLSSELYVLATNEGGEQETLANYYAFNFAHCVVFAYLLLEGIESPAGKVFYEAYLRGLWNITQYHRNAWFNVIYLAIASKPGNNPIIERDIEDQLMRLDINHFPDRKLGHLPIPEDTPTVDIEGMQKEFFENRGWGYLYSIPFVEFNWDHEYFTHPLTVEYHNTGNFMWEHSPFRNSSSEVNILHEMPGTTFTVPYWIMRAYGYIGTSGIREAL